MCNKVPFTMCNKVPFTEEQCLVYYILECNFFSFYVYRMSYVAVCCYLGVFISLNWLQNNCVKVN